MKTLAVIVLAVAMLSAAFVGVALAQPAPNTSSRTPFSAGMNFMSEAGYTRYLNHQQTGQWTPFTP
jgi:NADH:ubiquinone oxidoreductase subunit 3 (subunit A)